MRCGHGRPGRGARWARWTRRPGPCWAAERGGPPAPPPWPASISAWGHCHSDATWADAADAGTLPSGTCAGAGHPRGPAGSVGQTGGQGRTDHVRAEKRQEQSPSRAEWPGDRAGGLGGVGGQGHPAVRSHSRPASRHGAGHHVHMPAHVGMVGVDEEVLSAASGAQLRGPDPGRHPGTGQSRSAARAGHMPSFRTNPRWSPDDQLLREQLRRDPVVEWQAFYRRSTCVRARVCVCVRRCTCVHVCGCLHVHAYTRVMCALPYVHV